MRRDAGRPHVDIQLSLRNAAFYRRRWDGAIPAIANSAAAADHEARFLPSRPSAIALSNSAASSTGNIAVRLIQQLAREALELKQVDKVLFVHAGRVVGRVVRRHRAFVPNSLRNSILVGLQVTVDVFPARPRG